MHRGAERSAIPLAITLAVSGVAHAAVTAVVGAPSPPRRSAASTRTSTVEVTVSEPRPRPSRRAPEPEVREPPDPPDPPPPSNEPRSAAPPPSRRAPPPRGPEPEQRQERSAGQVAVAHPGLALRREPQPEPEREQDAAERPAAPKLDIDPRSAAIGSIDLGPAPQQGTASGAVRREGSDAPRDDDGRALERRLERDLAHRANARRHVSERPAPELRRRRDGSYAWDGPTIDAVIAPDGRVSFSDRQGLDFGADADSGRSAQLGVPLDVTSALERAHGNDPYYAERRWFLQQTEEMRGRLAARHRERNVDVAVRKLRGRLKRIWADDGRSGGQRRAALFRIWDDCSEDEAGAQARDAVEQFIRDRLPEGSPAGYAPDELERLNRDRRSASRFAPYE